MKWSLESLANDYRAAHKGDDGSSLGLGFIGLQAFYSAIGVSQPVSADLSANLVRAYQFHVQKNLHPAYSSMTLLDTQKFLLFIYKQGVIRVDYSSLIKFDLQALSTNDYSAYEQQPRWKS